MGFSFSTSSTGTRKGKLLDFLVGDPNGLVCLCVFVFVTLLTPAYVERSVVTMVHLASAPGSCLHFFNALRFSTPMPYMFVPVCVFFFNYYLS